MDSGRASPDPDLERQQAARGLAEGWGVEWSVKRRRVYYVNKPAGTTQWERPHAPPAP
jgi:hypothetical protein